MNHMQHKKTSQRAQRKQARQPHPVRALQGSHGPVAAQAASPAEGSKPSRDGVLVRAASSLGASAAAGMVTAATFPAASFVLPLGIAAIGGAVVAMIARHQAG